MKLTVLGAAREVTGSSYLVETDTVRFLVDCGMVQGAARDAATRNRQPFAFNPRSLDFALLTHAHIDHSGMLPKLTKDGFGGPILTTPATADLLDVMLRDSAHIQEMDAARAARGGRGTRRATPGPTVPIGESSTCPSRDRCRSLSGGPPCISGRPRQSGCSSARSPAAWLSSRCW